MDREVKKEEVAGWIVGEVKFISTMLDTGMHQECIG